ncbi:MAG: hypothetical protein ACI9UU_002746, partial [Candidatus Azotimanducaceae bacterium]
KSGAIFHADLHDSPSEFRVLNHSGSKSSRRNDFSHLNNKRKLRARQA